MKSILRISSFVAVLTTMLFYDEPTLAGVFEDVANDMRIAARCHQSGDEEQASSCVKTTLQDNFGRILARVFAAVGPYNEPTVLSHGRVKISDPETQWEEESQMEPPQMEVDLSFPFKDCRTAFPVTLSVTLPGVCQARTRVSINPGADLTRDAMSYCMVHSGKLLGPMPFPLSPSVREKEMAAIIAYLLAENKRLTTELEIASEFVVVPSPNAEENADLRVPPACSGPHIKGAMLDAMAPVTPVTPRATPVPLKSE